jgi:hypothetical protein
MQGLLALPAPVYIVGIHEREEKGYIFSANADAPHHISSLSTKHSIDKPETLERLWNEVRSFWFGCRLKFTGSTFVE